MEREKHWQPESNCVYQALLRLLGTTYRDLIKETILLLISRKHRQTWLYDESWIYTDPEQPQIYGCQNTGPMCKWCTGGQKPSRLPCGGWQNPDSISSEAVKGE